MYWQYLRMRYMMSGSCKRAFGTYTHYMISYVNDTTRKSNREKVCVGEEVTWSAVSYLLSLSQFVSLHALATLRMQLDRVLLGPSTYCPAVIGGLYVKLCGFLERMGDPAEAQRTSCTIM